MVVTYAFAVEQYPIPTKSVVPALETCFSSEGLSSVCWAVDDVAVPTVPSGSEDTSALLSLLSVKPLSSEAAVVSTVSGTVVSLSASASVPYADSSEACGDSAEPAASVVSVVPSIASVVSSLPTAASSFSGASVALGSSSFSGS